MASLDRVGVQGVLAGLPSIGRNIAVTSTNVPVRMSELDSATRSVEDEIAEWLDGIATPLHRVVTAPGHLRAGAEENPRWAAMRFHLVEGMEREVTFTAGRYPAAVPEPVGDEPLLEAAAYAEAAADLGISPGDTVRARPHGPGNGFTVRISGLFTPDDPSSDFWMGFARSLLEPEPLAGASGPTVALFVNADGLRRLARESPTGRLSVAWLVPLDREKLGGLGATEIIARMEGFQAGLERSLPGAFVISGLETAFERFDRRAGFAKVPMFLMAALLVTLVAYYLFMAATTLVARRQDEIGTLRSRGISRPQIARLFGIEALFLIGLPGLAAPLLAMVAIAQAGRLPLFRGVTDGAPLPVSFTWTALALAIGTAAVAIAIVVLPVTFAGSGSVAARKRVISRPESQPLFQRYFLDAAAIILGGLLVWELSARGGAAVSETGGGGQANAGLVATPALLLVGVSLLFLRLFPLAAKAAAWIAGRTAPVWATIALWRLSRTPYTYSTGVLLLLLVAGLGAVAATLTSTLRQSAGDRVGYATISDIRLTGLPDALALSDELRGIDGVAGVSAVLRAPGQVGTTGSGPSFNVIAVDPAAFEEIAWFRSDFSRLPLSRVMRSISVTARPAPILLPEGVTEIGAWTRMEKNINNLFLWAVIRTGDGRVLTSTLGAVLPGGWRYQSADLENMNMIGPVELVSLLLFEPSGSDTATAGVVYLDDVTALAPDAAGNPVRHVVVDFDDRGLWTAFPTSEGFDATFSLAQELEPVGERPGSGVARFAMGRGADGEVRGFYRSDTRGPLPVAASRTLIDRTSVVPGTPFVASVGSALTPLVVVAVVDYFPGLDPGDDSGFVVMDLDGLLRYRESRRLTTTGGVHEALVGLRPGNQEGAVDEIRNLLPAAAQLASRAEEEDKSLVDPLAVAGWRGVGLLTAAATGVVGVLGYLTYLSAYAGRVRSESAFLRALGITRGQFVRIVAMEHVLVGGAGLAIGAVAGLAMSRIAVAASVQGVDGKPPLPPFQLVTEWAPLGVMLGVVVAVVLIGAAGLVRGFAASRLHEIARLEE